MTDILRGAPTAQESPRTDPPDGAAILVGFAGPAPQRRLTVLLRIVLAIPQFVVLYVVGIAAAAVAVIGWFCALFTGRLPQFAADFLTGYLRWATRIGAYVLLLTDAYPPFTMSDADYPVRVATRPGRLNRLAVLFRLLLVLPAYILGAVLAYGVGTIVLFVTWLIVLVTGTMPGSMHQALAAVVRYQSRLSGYLYLLTSEYPSGLFGDQPAAASPAAGPTADSALATAPPAPAPGYSMPQAYGAAAESGTVPAGFGVPAGATAGWPAGEDRAVWTLVLSAAARRLVWLFLGLGVATVVAYVIVLTVALGGGTAANAVHQANAAHRTLLTAVRSFDEKSVACRSSSQQLACLTAADRQAGAAFDTFAQRMLRIHMPATASTAVAGELAATSSQAAGIFRQLGSSATAAQFQSRQALVTGHLLVLLNQVNTEWRGLAAALGATLVH